MPRPEYAHALAAALRGESGSRLRTAASTAASPPRAASADAPASAHVLPLALARWEAEAPLREAAATALAAARQPAERAPHRARPSLGRRPAPARPHDEASDPTPTPPAQEGTS